MAKKFKRITGAESATQKRRRTAAKAAVQNEFPPKRRRQTKSVGIGKRFRDSRKAQGLTWYAVAKKAGIPNSGTVRAIEEGQDAKLSSVEAIAKVLGLKLEVVDAI